MTQRAAPDGTSTPVDTGTIPASDEDQLRGPMLNRPLLDSRAHCYKPPIRTPGHDSFERNAISDPRRDFWFVASAALSLLLPLPTGSRSLGASRRGHAAA